MRPVWIRVAAAGVIESSLALTLVAAGCYRPNPAFRSEPLPDAATGAGVDRTPDFPASSDLASAPDLPGSSELAPGPDAALPVDQGVDASAPPDQQTVTDMAVADLPVAEVAAETGAARVIAVAAGGSSPAIGGTGGMRFDDTCGAGEALIGYRGSREPFSGSSAEDYIVALQALCGRLQATSGQTAVGTTLATVLPLRFMNTGPRPLEAICPGGTAIVSFGAIWNADFIHQFQFRCAPLAAPASGAGSIVPGAPTSLPWTGMGFGGSTMTAGCPAGQFARGHVLRIGSLVDGFQLVCGTATVGP